MQKDTEDNVTRTIIQSHATWYSGKTVFSKQVPGIMKLVNKTFTFTDESGKELQRLSVDEIKSTSVHTVGRGAIFMITPLNKQDAKLKYLPYKAKKEAGAQDEPSMYKWRTAFQKANVPNGNRVASVIVLILVLLAISLSIVFIVKLNHT